MVPCRGCGRDASKGNLMAQEIEKLQSKSLSETIGQELVRLIASGALKPGQRLNEVHLAESFGVSRGPVREAARELEGQGLVISRPRQGFYVADFTARQIIDLYEVKHWIDTALIHDFLTYADAETCRTICDDIASIDSSDKVAFSDTLFAFRRRMVARLHNRFLAGQALSLYRQFHIVTALINVSDSAARMTRIITTLRAFWTAMEAGDGEKAQQIMRDDEQYWRRDVAPRFAAGPGDDHPQID